MIGFVNLNFVLHETVIIKYSLFSTGPLVVKNSDSGAFTLIGVTCDAPYEWEQYRLGPYATYSRVSAVLPWIYETMKIH